jgi:hypothetical protein
VRQLNLAIGLALSAAAARGQQTGAPPKALPPQLVDANIQATPIPGLPPRLTLKTGRIIDGRTEKIDRVPSVALSPKGELIVVGWRLFRAYDSTGRRLWSADTTQRDEIGTINSIGWRGSQMWLADPRYEQIALLDRGTVTKSLELPSWIRPTFANRKSFPVWSYADVRALFDDGSMIVLPSAPHSILGAVDYDSTMQYVVKVKESGIIQGVITKFPNLTFAEAKSWAIARETHYDVPYRWLLHPDFWPRLRISTDGKRVVLVSIDTSAASTDTVVVAAMNEQGQSLWTRKLAFPRRAYSQHEIDSIAKKMYSRGDAETRGRQIRAIPRKLPSVRGVVLGRDNSVWVTFRETRPVKPIVGIDGNGQVLGTVYVPNSFQLRAADRGMLWIVDERWQMKSIVGYALVKP